MGLMARTAVATPRCMRIAIGSWTLVTALLTTACTGTAGSPDPGPVMVQTEYDLTIAADRELFTEQDMAYVSSVGPYAVYEVTGPDPRLFGPSVLFWNRTDPGYAMLCSAQGYFTADRTIAPAVRMQLMGGRHGDEVIVTALQMPRDDGGCIEARDDTGNRIPPEDDGPEAQDGDDAPEAGGDPDAAMGEDFVEPMSVSFDQAPPIGAELLLRRVALSGEAPQHNGSHVIPPVCCDGKDCILQP